MMRIRMLSVFGLFLWSLGMGGRSEAKTAGLVRGMKYLRTN